MAAPQSLRARQAAQGLPSYATSDTATQMRRSRRLEEALETMAQQRQQPITGGWGQLASQLAATYILDRSGRKSDAALAAALLKDRKSAGDKSLATLGIAEPAASQLPAAPPPPPPQTEPTAASASPALSGNLFSAMSGNNAASQTAAAPLDLAAGLKVPKAGTDFVATVWPKLEHRESRGRQSAVSPAGAFGVAQLMPQTAREVASRLGDPSLSDRARTDSTVNRQLGQAYLSDQMQAFGEPVLALAAYNAGPGMVEDWISGTNKTGKNGRGVRLGDPRKGEVSPEQWAASIPFRETRDYVANLAPQGGPQIVRADYAPPMQAQPVPQVPGIPAGAPQQANPAFGQPVGPTSRETAFLRQAYASGDERQFAQAEALAMQIQARMMEPRKFETMTVNGVPTWVDPMNPGAMQTGAVPQGAMSRPGAAAEGVGLVPGTAFEVSPTGERRILQSPPTGYQGPGGSGGPVARGPEDPYRQQAPQPGMQYSASGQRQQPIAGLERRPLTPAEVQEAGLPTGTVAQREPDGSVRVIDKIEEGERRTANLAFRAYQGLERLNGLAEKGMYRPSPQLEWVDPFLGMGEGGFRIRNSEDRQFVQASKEFLAPILRKDTGAAVTDTELHYYQDILVPRSGDDPTTLWQKAQARADATRGIINEAGPAFSSHYGAPNVRSLTDPRGQPQQAAPLAQQQRSPALPPLPPPRAGEVRNGYVYMGGDPKKETSWKRAR